MLPYETPGSLTPSLLWWHSFFLTPKISVRKLITSDLWNEFRSLRKPCTFLRMDIIEACSVVLLKNSCLLLRLTCSRTWSLQCHFEAPLVTVACCRVGHPHSQKGLRTDLDERVRSGAEGWVRMSSSEAPWPTSSFTFWPNVSWPHDDFSFLSASLELQILK